MAILFVHGVPATSRLWAKVIGHLDQADEFVAVDLPGMAAPPPAGWIADKDNYVAWLIGEIEALVARSGDPIHFVGHDWGLPPHAAGGVAPARAAAQRRRGQRADRSTGLHAWWHVWNQPGAGEEATETVLGPNAVALMTALGFPPEDAAACSFATDFGRRQCWETSAA